MCVCVCVCGGGGGGGGGGKGDEGHGGREMTIEDSTEGQKKTHSITPKS